MFITAACAMQLRNMSQLNCSFPSPFFPFSPSFHQAQRSPAIRRQRQCGKHADKDSVGYNKWQKKNISNHTTFASWQNTLAYTHTYRHAHNAIARAGCLSVCWSIYLARHLALRLSVILSYSLLFSSSLSISHCWHLFPAFFFSLFTGLFSLYPSLSRTPLFHCSKLLLPHCQLLLMSF